MYVHDYCLEICMKKKKPEWKQLTEAALTVELSGCPSEQWPMHSNIVPALPIVTMVIGLKQLVTTVRNRECMVKEMSRTAMDCRGCPFPGV